MIYFGVSYVTSEVIFFIRCHNILMIGQIYAVLCWKVCHVTKVDILKLYWNEVPNFNNFLFCMEHHSFLELPINIQNTCGGRLDACVSLCSCGYIYVNSSALIYLAFATTVILLVLLCQRDTTGLTTENSELKIRLQTMEQQVHLQDGNIH